MLWRDSPGRQRIDAGRSQRSREPDQRQTDQRARVGRDVRDHLPLRAAEADPRVQEVLARFPGAKVVEVRKLTAEPPESDAIGEDPSEISDSDDD